MLDKRFTDIFDLPVRRQVLVSDDHETWTVCVADPPGEVVLTLEQWKRFDRWTKGQGLLWALLPELTAEQRDILMAGIEDYELPDIREVRGPDQPPPTDDELLQRSRAEAKRRRQLFEIKQGRTWVAFSGVRQLVGTR